MAKDEDYKRMIHSYRWLKLRKHVLSMHPICQRCEEEGYLTPATEVHHIRPVEEATSLKEKESLMFDPTNLRALCRRCHLQTHREARWCSKEAVEARTKSKVDAFIKKYMQ